VKSEVGVFQKRFSASWECQTPLPHKRVRRVHDSDSDSADDTSSYTEEIKKRYVKETLLAYIHTGVMHSCSQRLD